jgi:hypothetical protein
MENTNVQDTSVNANPNDPSNAFEGQSYNAQDSSSELSVDDIILGKVEDSASAFGTPETGTPIQPQIPEDAKNDDTRYEYWQSQAAKKENELNNIKAQQQQAMQMQQQAMMQRQQQAQAQPEQQKFPDAPEKPSKPRNYSREDAYADSNSESARYLDEVEEWRDDIEEYKDLRHQYDVAVVQDQMRAQQEQRVTDIKRQQAYQAQAQQLQGVHQKVQEKYGLSQEEAGHFIKDMSSNDSLTMDNLVQLWRMRQGQGAPVGQPVPSNPSPTFQQTKRAQQIPSPMGVMSSTGNQTQGSTEDQIMDRMITDMDSKNPFKLNK